MKKQKKPDQIFRDRGFTFDMSKGSAEFHQAYDLAKAVKDAGFLNPLMGMSMDMLEKVTPEGTVPILHLGVQLAFERGDRPIGISAHTESGEQLTMVYDEKNNAYRTAVHNGSLKEPIYLMIKTNDVPDCLGTIQQAVQMLHT